MVGLVLALLVAVGLSAAGCADDPDRPLPAPEPILTGSHPCTPGELGSSDPGPVAKPGGVTFSCARLTVPLDHPGLRAQPRHSGELALPVAVSDNVGAPRGVLIRLTGGPGQPGLAQAADITATELAPEVTRDYRLVFIDQRGTGVGALRCPELQLTSGANDLDPPKEGAVQACGQRLGGVRRFYSTADTVADLEALRQALRVPKLSVDGVSYGTFVAARYAITHPDRVARLVLDSVVPHDGPEALETVVLGGTARVLNLVCERTACGTDPVADLAKVVRTRHDGPELLATITVLTSGKPDLNAVPAALHRAAAGDYAALDAIIDTVRRNQAVRPEQLSLGLHASTLCQDMHGPWGDASTPVAGRAEAIHTAVDALPDDAFLPYDRAAAADNGRMVTCRLWPNTPVLSYPAGIVLPAGTHNLPAVPVLLLAGDHDLLTPMEWAQREASRAPAGRLVVIPGAGHVTQRAANGPLARAEVARFLTEPGG